MAICRLAVDPRMGGPNHSMDAFATNSNDTQRVPTWTVVVWPIVAVVLSNADVLFLAIVKARTQSIDLAITVTTVISIMISIAACAVTLWFLLRLKHEVEQRAFAFAALGQVLDREQLLRRELDHRVRNNLSALLALVGLYENTDTSAAEILHSLRGKVLALRESFSLISETHGEGIELAELLHAVVAASISTDKSDRVTVAGPSARLTSREANAFAMIIEELLTNARKHGALRRPDGTIRVTWESVVDGDHVRVSMRWVEQPIAERTEWRGEERSGLGLTLIEGFATSDLRGDIACRASNDQWLVDLTANLSIPLVEAHARTHLESHA